VTIIFDFDGTIADSFSAVVGIFHELTHRSQLVTPEEIVRLRHMRLMDVARAEKISKWRAPFLLLRGRRMMAKRLGAVNAFGGIPDAIEQAHAAGHQLFIMSSNSTSNVRKFLREHELDQYFTKVYGGVGLLGKARALKRILRANQLQAAECIYIGDEPRDIDASNEVGMKCIAVTWGFNAVELLRDHKPYAIARTPEKLLSLLQADTIK
jgi:phosphoglycolate phosphatase-like HAD superfamily hydrolase